jgi:hypothetical protein
VYWFDAELWLHDGAAGWHFVTLPPEVSDDIDARVAGRTRGFGSVRVRATIGSTTWHTSVFPDTRREAFLLPVKKQVRTAAAIEDGDRITVGLHLVSLT